MSNPIRHFYDLLPSAKFYLLLSSVVFFLVTIILGIIIPTWQEERLESETRSMEHLLSSMEHQIRLTIHVNSLYNTSYWEKLNLEMQNKLFALMASWQASSQQTPTTLAKLLEEHFSTFACNALLLEESSIIYATQTPLIPKVFDTSTSPSTSWYIHDKTQQTNICPASDKEYLFRKPIPNSPYEVALLCHSKELLKSRSEFETTVGSMLKQSFQNFKHANSGFLYMMWVDESHQPCDHNATLRKGKEKESSLANQHCCVSESSPTQQPLTGTLSPADLLKAAHEGKPIHHALPTLNDARGTLYPALTWVRLFKGNREYPLVLVATVYEEAIYHDVEPLFLKFLPAIIIALGSASLLGWLLFRRFTSKIDRLLSVAKSVQCGNLTERSHITGEDDISILAKTFDAMLDSLHENIDLLDSKVADRTAQLEALLQEKEVLLKEIHHRVKNNLSIVIALMQLKENQAISEESQSLLIELQERIYAIELLHRQLYQSTSLKDIAFDVYVMGLMQSMAATYAFDRKNIAMHLDIQPMYLGIEQALACGLIINECVTNTIKHAFHEQGGTIYLTFTCHEDLCTLIIGDNGKGLSQHPNSSLEEGLGMQLIQGIITQQLQGHFTLTSDKGTCFTIHFKP